jgi:DnaJ-class molecular chaperone
MTMPILVALLLLFVQRAQSHSSSSWTDPYAVLGVSRGDSDAVIKKQYHKLCLRYHPDKQSHKTVKEKKRFEEVFKQVQAAYSQINNSQSQQDRPYNNMQNKFGSSPHDTFSFEQMLRDYQQRTSHRYSRMPSQGFPLFSTRSSFFPATVMFGMSIFQESVYVPLETLYQGETTIQHTLKTNVWRRIIASFRGGAAYPLLYASLLYALPLVRVFGKRMALFAWLALFLYQIPDEPLIQTTLEVPLRPGYKQGTRLTFALQHRMQVCLILKALRHEHYKLIGNDLHTSMRLTRAEAEFGCRKHLVKLVVEEDDDDDRPALQVEVPAGTQHGDEITIAGEGWPIRKSNGRHGNLCVHVEVETRSQELAERLRRRAMYISRVLSNSY